MEGLPKGLHQADSELFKQERQKISLLVVSDYMYNFMHIEDTKGLTNSLVLLQSQFGWIPAGSIGSTPSTQVDNNQLTILMKKDAKGLDTSSKLKILESQEVCTLWWSLEAMGIRKKELVDKDMRVLQHFKETVRYENGRYVASFCQKITENSLQKTIAYVWLA